MGVDTADAGLSRIAAAIAAPARTRMLCSLLDGHARTATELAVVAGVSPSTASAHLARLEGERLVKPLAQGKHPYYSLQGPRIARALETLMTVSGQTRHQFVPNTPSRLRAARTCYDHMAGEVAVSLHDRFQDLRWLSSRPGKSDVYDLTRKGEAGLEAAGIDVGAMRALRRRFAFACVDWSERRPHIGGALGAAIMGLATRRKWVVADLDSRILSLTPAGRHEMQARWGVHVPTAIVT